MPNTAIACVKDLACNEPNQFIFTDRSGCLIGDIDITLVDRDAADSNKNQAPQDPAQDIQATKQAYEEPLISYPNIDLDINHETPTEQVQSTEEPREDPVQPPTTSEETNRPNQTNAVVRRSVRVRTRAKSYTPFMSRNRYAYVAVKIPEQEVLHQYAHAFFDKWSIPE